MKRLILAGLGALAVVTTMGSANAADMPRRQTEMPVKAPLYEPPFSWTGFYIGINGGGAWGRSDWSNTLGTNTIDTSGAVVGGTIGYNYQMGQTVFGLEGDGDWSNLRGSTTGGDCTGTSCETHNSWLATARGRLGYAFGRFMPYVTGGAAFGDVKATAAGLGSQTTTRVGWTGGGGVEAAIAGPWSAKIEYLYVDLGKGNCDAATCGLATSASLTSSLVRGGINYRF
jgi:outer membrane immunogenic protein